MFILCSSNFFFHHMFSLKSIHSHILRPCDDFLYDFFLKKAQFLGKSLPICAFSSFKYCCPIFKGWKIGWVNYSICCGPGMRWEIKEELNKRIVIPWQLDYQHCWDPGPRVVPWWDHNWTTLLACIFLWKEICHNEIIRENILVVAKSSPDFRDRD